MLQQLRSAVRDDLRDGLKASAPARPAGRSEGAGSRSRPVGRFSPARRAFFPCFSATISPGGQSGPGASGRAFPRETRTETNFPRSEIEFIGGRNGPETQGCNPSRVINNGVGSMSIILRLIYREYCRACLGHLKYF
jgi:hypothetical protein